MDPDILLHAQRRRSSVVFWKFSKKGLSGPRPRYRLILVEHVQVPTWVFNFLSWEWWDVSHPDSESHCTSYQTSEMKFLYLVYHLKSFSAKKFEHARWTWTCSRPDWACTQAWLGQTFFENFPLFVRKTKPKTFVFEHVKGYPDPSIYGKNKRGITCYTNRGTPCSNKEEGLLIFISSDTLLPFSTTSGGKPGKKVAEEKEDKIVTIMVEDVVEEESP